MQRAGLKVPSAIANLLFKMAEEGRKDKKDEEIKKNRRIQAHSEGGAKGAAAPPTGLKGPHFGSKA